MRISRAFLGRLRNQVEVDILMKGGMGDLDLGVEERDPTVAIDDTGHV